MTTFITSLRGAEYRAERGKAISTRKIRNRIFLVVLLSSCSPGGDVRHVSTGKVAVTNSPGYTRVPWISGDSSTASYQITKPFTRKEPVR